MVNCSRRAQIEIESFESIMLSEHIHHSVISFGRKHRFYSYVHTEMQTPRPAYFIEMCGSIVGYMAIYICIYICNQENSYYWIEIELHLWILIWITIWIQLWNMYVVRISYIFLSFLVLVRYRCRVVVIITISFFSFFFFVCFGKHFLHYNPYTKVSHGYREYWTSIYTNAIYFTLFLYPFHSLLYCCYCTCSTISLWAIFRVNILMLYNVIYIHSLQLTFSSIFFPLCILLPPVRSFNGRQQAYLMQRFIKYILSLFSGTDNNRHKIALALWRCHKFNVRNNSKRQDSRSIAIDSFSIPWHLFDFIPFTPIDPNAINCWCFFCIYFEMESIVRQINIKMPNSIIKFKLIDICMPPFTVSTFDAWLHLMEFGIFRFCVRNFHFKDEFNLRRTISSEKMQKK